MKKLQNLFLLTIFSTLVAVPMGMAAKWVDQEELDEALLKATLNSDMQSVKTAIKNGASIDAKNDFGWTPLHIAAFTGSLPIVKLLIEKGAGIHAKTNNGSTPALLARSKGYKEVANLIEKNTAKEVEKLLEDWTMVEPLSLEKNKKVEEEDWAMVEPIVSPEKQKRLDMALFDAIKKGNLEKVAETIKNGADVNVETVAGWPLLHYAVHGGNLLIVKLLIDKGANVNAKNISGKTPLHIAAFTGSLPIVKLLIEKGADPRIKDNDGFVPCDSAIQGNRQEIVDFFLVTTV